MIRALFFGWLVDRGTLNQTKWKKGTTGLPRKSNKVQNAQIMVREREGAPPALHEALVAVLKDLKGFLRLHRRVRGGPHR